MRATISLILICINLTTLFSQEEARPLFDTEIVRKVSSIDIEGTEYQNVEVTLKSISPDGFISDKYRVKVIIKDIDGTKVWKKTLSNTYLYAFSSGQVEVGQPKFTQIIIQPHLGSHVGMIRVKAGIY